MVEKVHEALMVCSAYYATKDVVNFASETEILIYNATFTSIIDAYL